jgi:flagellar secretion chaperone FliS
MTPPSLKAAAAYRNVGLQTRAAQHDQYQLVVMMFEAVLESLVVARGAIEQKDVATKIQKIDKAIRIIQEGLRTSLDLDNGGELAANLANLYEYCVLRLTQANAANSTAMLEEVGNLIKPVAEAWKQLRSGAPAETPAPQTTTAAAVAAPATPSTAAKGGAAFQAMRQLSGLYGGKPMAMAGV